MNCEARCCPKCPVWLVNYMLLSSSSIWRLIRRKSGKALGTCRQLVWLTRTLHTIQNQKRRQRACENPICAHEKHANVDIPKLYHSRGLCIHKHAHLCISGTPDKGWIERRAPTDDDTFLGRLLRNLISSRDACRHATKTWLMCAFVAFSHQFRSWFWFLTRELQKFENRKQISRFVKRKPKPGKREKADKEKL